MLVLTTPSFNKDISKIKDGKLSARIEKVILKMQSAHDMSELSSVKKLSGSPNAYRIKIADYRLGFTLSDNIIKLIFSPIEKKFIDSFRSYKRFWIL